jgi:thioredoxin reductase (NADPH)
MKKIDEQARGVGVSFVMEEVIKLELKGKEKKIMTSNKTYSCKAVIIASGGAPRKLEVAGEKDFVGKGVSYCATCDGYFFKGKTVAVVGGGNTAVDEALFMADLAKKVYLIHRRDELRAEKMQSEKLRKKGVELVLSATLERVKGGKFVNAVEIKQKGKAKELKVDAVFIAVGVEPSSQIASDAGVKTDEGGLIVVDKKQKTSVEGVFAAGNISSRVWQLVVAAAEGAVAALSAYDYVKEE